MTSMLRFGHELRNRVLFHLRAVARDVSGSVQWVDTTIFDRPEVADSYDTAKLERGMQLTTFRAHQNLEFIDMVKRLKIRSVLDLGCGAGSFFHALASVDSEIAYFGYDASPTQIELATRRFGNRFAVRDIAEIGEDEFSRYDAVHAWSVFSFLPVELQVATIRRIIRSGARLLVETGVTKPDIRYAPRSQFKSFSNVRIDDSTLLSVTSFPYRTEMIRAIAGSGHCLTFSERTYPGGTLLNRSGRSGGALIAASRLKRRSSAWDRILPSVSVDRLLWARIAPKEWEESRTQDYASMSGDEVHARFEALIRPVAEVGRT